MSSGDSTDCNWQTGAWELVSRKEGTEELQQRYWEGHAGDWFHLHKQAILLSDLPSTHSICEFYNWEIHITSIKDREEPPEWTICWLVITDLSWHNQPPHTRNDFNAQPPWVAWSASLGHQAGYLVLNILWEKYGKFCSHQMGSSSEDTNDIKYED